MLKKLLKNLTEKDCVYPCIDCGLHGGNFLYINTYYICSSCFSPFYKIHRKCILELKRKNSSS